MKDVELETDTHWRAEKGQGVFNWRFRYQLTLPLADPTRLTLKLWDKDVLGPSDLIGSCTLDLNKLERPSLLKRKNKRNREDGKTADPAVTPLLKKGLKVYREYKSYSRTVENMTETELLQNLAQIRMKRPGQGTKAGRAHNASARSRLGTKLPIPPDASVEQLRDMLLQYLPRSTTPRLLFAYICHDTLDTNCTNAGTHRRTSSLRRPFAGRKRTVVLLDL